MPNKYNLPTGAIITRISTFQMLTDKEKEMITKGFKDHLATFPEVKDKTHREIYELLTVANPQYIFYTLKGHPHFKMRMSKKAVLFNQMANSKSLD